MAPLKLYIGNKNYSSWSFRPWLAMTAAGIPFEEALIRFDFPAGNPDIKAVSESGKVPLLQNGKVKVWESLAIIEYVAELYPDHSIWPGGMEKRALARAVSAEMASSFSALRSHCPMNFRQQPIELKVDDATKADIARINHIWTSQIAAHGGPFLFGDFSAADAMYAPVVNRFDIYGLTPSPEAEIYMENMKSHFAWKAWETEALKEPWVVPEDEI
ncbi:glutathione S-transferase family protein [Rhizobium sp. L1K21]|uniref:glutathione S-transferase family protein n=1 Tax=Rhizobium sp. L1K21 TaxID=2954933 RepID=UPI0020939180|nr:glutathione S-transferase family protein [Rhizobium sp. L1K21]MCO6188125.1 glutathione S-transferase family protein [Rhizobium sp. L1K21]